MSRARKVREVPRLNCACAASERGVISCLVGIGRTAIGKYIRRTAVIGITWPVPEELDEAGAGGQGAIEVSS
jgi:hypothetical protein